MALERLAYVSVAAEPFTQPQLDELLAKARDFNRAHGITGLLVYYEPYFAQVIEGPPAEIDALIRSIDADPRHRGLFVFQRVAASSRLFAQWEMGFERRSRAEVEALDGFVDFFAPGGPPRKAPGKLGGELEDLLASLVRPA